MHIGCEAVLLKWTHAYPDEAPGIFQPHLPILFGCKWGTPEARMLEGTIVTIVAYDGDDRFLVRDDKGRKCYVNKEHLEERK